MNWREATCEKCTFRVDDKCRRFPPGIQGGTTDNKNSRYPIVKSGFDGVSLIDGYRYKVHISDACAEYAEAIQPMTIKEATR